MFVAAIFGLGRNAASLPDAAFAVCLLFAPDHPIMQLQDDGSLALDGVCCSAFSTRV